MGLSWQQGPLSSGAIGRFLVPEPLPKRLLYVEPLRRRMRVRFGGNWIADSENVLLLFEPGHYPMAYFPESRHSPNTWHTPSIPHEHADLGLTSWYIVRASGNNRGARSMATYRLASARQRIAGTRRVRLAGHGRLL